MLCQKGDKWVVKNEEVEPQARFELAASSLPRRRSNLSKLLGLGTGERPQI